MCDCVPSSTLTFLSCFRIGITKLGFSRSCCSDLNLDSSGFGKKGRLRLVVTNARSAALGSNEYDKEELQEFNKERGITIRQTELETVGYDDGDDDEDGINDASSSVEFLEFNEKTTEAPPEVEVSLNLKEEEDNDDLTKIVRRSARQLLKRSNIIAKQVICLQSALTLGFVSQLWVDTNSWVVLVLEVRPNLLSGEIERFLLDDVTQVGDVVLIQDESVIENEFKLFGLETLVGYTVVTPSRRNIGKVRGFTFNINSGAVESLELDSFGISIIPSTLVSTYALFVDDVLEVVSDTVVVEEAAATHIQRITKGVWDAQNVGNSIEELGDDSNLERQPARSDHKRSRRRSFTGRKLRPKMRDTGDDWELPMDYL